MRALLLLVLGAGLVWFVWRGFGPGNSTEAAAPGSMIRVDAPDAAEGSTPGADIGATPAATSATDVRAQDSEPARADTDAGASAAPDVTPAPIAAPEPDRGTGHAAALPTATTPVAASAAEIEAADRLLRDPVLFAEARAGGGAGLALERHAYAEALVHALAARESDTRSALDRAGTAATLAERELAERIAARSATEGALTRDSALGRAAQMKDLERVAAEHLGAGRSREASLVLSRLLLAEIDSAWKSDPVRLARWSDQLREAQRGHRWNRRGKWPSAEIVVQPGDSLTTVRKRAVAQNAGLLVCTGLVARANELEGETIHPGAKLRIPLDPVRVLVDLDARWVFYLAGDEVVAAWPAGIGKESSATRIGRFTVGKKQEEPMWFPQGRKPVPFGDPENPLGTRWIAWNDTEGEATGLGFHGTNEPDSIGRDASLGCIRMRTSDVEELFEILPLGAPVSVVP